MSTIQFIDAPARSHMPAGLSVRLSKEQRDRFRKIAMSRGVTFNSFCVTALDGLAKACEAEVQTTVQPLREVGRVG